jgi:transposase
MLSDLPPYPICRTKKQVVNWKEKKGVRHMGVPKKKGAPPRYDEAFRQGAIQLVTEQGRPSTEVAAELGICIDTLRNWLKRAGVQAGAADRDNRQSRRQRELETENRALRKQLAEKEEVITVLKKSVGILSKP